MDLICSDCARQTEVIYDHSSGDTVCSECGLVLEAHFVDETAEWRTFADDSSQVDKNRVAGKSNPLLDDINVLITCIKNPNGVKSSNNIINSSKILRGNNKLEYLVTAFERIGTMADRLGLQEKIKKSGCELYKKVFYDDNNKKDWRGKNLEAALGACLLVVCQMDNVPRTVKEICSVVQEGKNGIKDVLKAKNTIMRQLVEIKNDYGNSTSGVGLEIGKTIRAYDLIKRFCSNLSLETKIAKAALEAASTCEKAVDVRRSPISIAAALIYVVIQLHDEVKNKIGIRDIANAASVAEGTIRNTYKDLYPSARKFVPSWYANEDKIRKLECNP